MTLKAMLAATTAVCSILAAALWWYASWVKVSPDKAEEMRQERGKLTGDWGAVTWTLADNSDMEFTLAAQSLWNRRAALAAGGAALSQALYVAITEFAASAS
jgi:hypothetical protein